MKKPLSLSSLSLVALIAFALVACGDDDGTDSPSPADSPTDTPPPESTFKSESRAALGPYLSSVGLDERTGELTDPLECAQLPDGDVEGDYCIVEPSVYAPALALILVADVEDPDNEVWQVRVVLDGEDWQVTEAVKLGP
jgi:hypothetical protein